MTARVWTPELIDELKRLRRCGRTFGQIARRLGVSRNAAIGAARRLGLVAAPRSRIVAASMEEPTALGGACEILGPGVCHWIAGDVGGAWRMCGRKAVPGKSWCEHHFSRVHERIVLSAAAQDEAA
jgi:GcrA cell cycle regulator